jgi:hypothetical protein
MAAHFIWYEDNGAGPTSTSGVSNVNWKNVDDTGTVYTASPITAGNNSYEKWQYGRFQGPFNQVLNGKWSHTAGVFGANLTLKGAPSGASQLTYATPSTTTNASLSVDMTAVTAIASGTAVYFGATGPNTAGKATSSTANPSFTNYLTTQLQTTASASAGDTISATITLQYDKLKLVHHRSNTVSVVRN